MSIQKIPSRLKATMFRQVASYILLELGYDIEKVKNEWYDFIAKKDDKTYKIYVVSKGLQSPRTFLVLKKNLKEKINSDDILIVCLFEWATGYKYYIFKGSQIASYWQYETDSNLLVGKKFLNFAIHSTNYKPIAFGEISKFDFKKEKKVYSFMTVVNSNRSIELPQEIEPGTKIYVTIEVLPYR